MKNYTDNSCNFDIFTVDKHYIKPERYLISLACIFIFFFDLIKL